MKIRTIGSIGSLFRGLLPLFIVAHFSHHLVIALLVPLSPLIRNEFNLDYTQSGLLYSSFILSYGISQLPAGWLADRLGPRPLLFLSISGVAFAGLLVGLSQTYIMVLSFLVLMGILGGGYHPSSPPLIAASVKLKNHGRVLGLHLTGGSLSFFIAPLLAAAIVSASGWRSSYIILAIPTFVFGIVLLIILNKKRPQKGLVQDVNFDKGNPVLKAQKSHYLVPYIILATFTAAVLISTISFIPLFLVDQFGVAEEAAAALIAVIYFAGLLASPIGGFLSDHIGRLPVLLAASFAAGPIIYLLTVVPYGLFIGVILFIIGFILYTPQPASEAYIVSNVSKNKRSSVLGIYFSGSLAGSGAITPVIGYIIDTFSFSTAFAIAAAAVFIVTMLCSFWFIVKNRQT